MKIRETKDIRFFNRLKILNTIIHHKHISRSDIASITKLNKATVSTIVKELLELEMVEESVIGDSTGGRKPIILIPREKIGYIIAVDINISQIDLIISDLGNNVLQKHCLDIVSKDFNETFNKLCDFIQKIMSTMPPCKYGFVGLGVAVRGVVDLHGVIRLIPKLGWKNIHIKELLEERLRVPVYVDNDGNFAAMAEYTFYPNLKELVVITIDHVISCGIIANGSIVRGFLGFANAVGHHVINCDGKKCVCGKKGCFEMYCSYSAILEKINDHIPVKNISEFVELVGNQHPIAMDTLNFFLDYLAIGLTNIIYILNCETIIINSYIFDQLPEILPELQKRIVLPITNYQDLELSKVGPLAPLQGAIACACKGFYKDLLNF